MSQHFQMPKLKFRGNLQRRATQLSNSKSEARNKSKYQNHEEDVIVARPSWLCQDCAVLTSQLLGQSLRPVRSFNVNRSGLWKEQKSAGK
jgi:hypothetical protein